MKESDKNYRDNLRRSFCHDATCYRYLLCEQYEWLFGDTYWVGDEVGGTLVYGDVRYAINYDEVRRLVDENVPFEVFKAWYERNRDVAYDDDKHYINLKTWLIMKNAE